MLINIDKIVMANTNYSPLYLSPLYCIN